MSQKPYKRKQGDFEIRILDDGRLVMIAPDNTLLEIAQSLENDINKSQTTKKEVKHAKQQRTGEKSK